ncbi:hypothetical protein D9611_009621 [Ephemerocybe angulata]|uniref:SGNH hydrolase-type esterase domain-containing protein n=1 Tax=Ephemerocybe angulata TaxID=980116 RepID=A0A8H5C835_9AGAR|nr:hypothetical protein D9611_009621 [Tulosesus angulatus]
MFPRSSMRFNLATCAALVALLPSALSFSGRVCRIMPLGASITYGVGSSDWNGYRAKLYLALQKDGNTVNMVGNNPSVNGTFKTDPDTEGWPGYIIDQVADKMRQSMPKNRPNIATILVGTNDMTGNIDVANAPKRLGKLIDDLLAFPPLTLVIVSSLPPNRNPDFDKRIKAYNAALPAVVQQRANAGRSVMYADCGGLVAVGDLNSDGTHPKDAAYGRIAQCFYDAIVAAEKKGWIWPVQGPAP